MTRSDLTDAEMEHTIQLQILEYEATNSRPRPLTKRDSASRALLQRAVLTCDVLRAAGIECDGNNTEDKISTAIKTLTSTKGGVAWINERIKDFP